MMLRPTESRVVWLQQFGRGLRKAEGKGHLTVIDYIGNHRAFLLKVRALFDLGPGYAEVARVLDQVSANQVTLPPGCAVTYDLVALEILQNLLPAPTGGAATVETYYDNFKDQNGVRPLAVEAFHDGYNPRTVRQAAGSWLKFVDSKGDLSAGQRRLLRDLGDFLNALEVTPMTRSFKALTLQAMLQLDALPGSVGMRELASEFARLGSRSAALRADVGVSLHDAAGLRRYLERNPLAAWAGGRGTSGKTFFAYAGGVFRSTFDVPGELREEFRELAREILDWRLAEYLQRGPADQGAGFVGRVSHSGGRPIVRLPDRGKTPGMPDGPTTLLADGEPYQANFVKVALNVMTRPGASENVLPEVLRRWFGANAGRPGTAFRVAFEQTEGAWTMAPLRAEDLPTGR